MRISGYWPNYALTEDYWPDYFWVIPTPETTRTSRNVYFETRDLYLYYPSRDKRDYYVSVYTTQDMQTELEEDITTEAGVTLQMDYYRDELTKPIFITMPLRDWQITFE